jgi:hypothetical protein
MSQNCVLEQGRTVAESVALVGVAYVLKCPWCEKEHVLDAERVKTFQNAEVTPAEVEDAPAEVVVDEPVAEEAHDEDVEPAHKSKPKPRGRR